MTPSAYKPTFAEIAANTVRWLDSDHSMFLCAMAIIGFVLAALNVEVPR